MEASEANHTLQRLVHSFSAATDNCLLCGCRLTSSDLKIENSSTNYSAILKAALQPKIFSLIENDKEIPNQPFSQYCEECLTGPILLPLKSSYTALIEAVREFSARRIQLLKHLIKGEEKAEDVVSWFKEQLNLPGGEEEKKLSQTRVKRELEENDWEINPKMEDEWEESLSLDETSSFPLEDEPDPVPPRRRPGRPRKLKSDCSKRTRTNKLNKDKSQLEIPTNRRSPRRAAVVAMESLGSTKNTSAEDTDESDREGFPDISEASSISEEEEDSILNVKEENLDKQSLSKSTSGKRIRYPPTPAVCPVCGVQLYAARYLPTHMRIHTNEKPYSCPHPGCKSSFRKKQNLTDHMKHHGQGKTYTCKYCFRSFHSMDKTDLNRHLRICHKMPGKVDLEKGANLKPYCNLCKLDFSSVAELDKHILEGGHVVKAQEAKELEQSKPSRTWKCKPCKMEFRSRSDLFRHKSDELHKESIRKTKEAKVKDPEPSLTLTSKLCPVPGCGFEADFIKNLHCHMISQHGHKGRYPCTLCSKSYHHKCTLDTHMKTAHADLSGKALYPCEHCEFSSKKIHLLREHLFFSHNEMFLESGPFVCEKVCYKNFMTEGELTEHMKGHEAKHRCPTCLKFFRNSQHLKKHVFIHSETKPFVCEVCGKGFSHESNLREHSMRHGKQYPHLCERCGKGFYRKKEMEKHFSVCCESYF